MNVTRRGNSVAGARLLVPSLISDICRSAFVGSALFLATFLLVSFDAVQTKLQQTEMSLWEKIKLLVGFGGVQESPEIDPKKEDGKENESPFDEYMMYPGEYYYDASPFAMEGGGGERNDLKK